MTSSPLPAVVYYSNEDRTLYSYSINGRLLENINDDSIHITSPIVVKDLNFSEILIYGNEKGEIYLRELPFLNIRKKFSVSHGSSVLSIMLSNDRKFLLCGCGDGEIAVLCDPNVSLSRDKPINPYIHDQMNNFPTAIHGGRDISKLKNEMS